MKKVRKFLVGALVKQWEIWMYSFSFIVVEGLLPGLLSTVEGSCWRHRDGYFEEHAEYEANAGSALCSGLYYPPISPSQPEFSVWLLHGSCPSAQGANYFQRYSVTGDAWYAAKKLPSGHQGEIVGWGGALAYGPDPYPVDSGRIFAFTGNNTNLFWMYSPPSDTWFRMPDVPEPVGAGGALCFGGEQILNNIRRAVFYALVGGGRSSFYRYSYPMEGASLGSWDTLASIPCRVQAGGALAWIPRTDSLREYPMGQVFAIAGQGNQPSYLYSYNPNTNTWRVETTFPYDVVIDSGAAMAPGVPAVTQHNFDVRIFPGGHSRAYLVWKPCSRALKYSHQTPCPQNSGAALCPGETAYSCYAVFGEGNCDTFQWHNGLDSTYEGGQARVSAMPNHLRIKVIPGAGEYRFIISCAPGPVSLKVIDVLGKVVVKTTAEAGSAGVDLNWRYRSFGSGVYFYKIETPSGSTSNKLVLTK